MDLAHARDFAQACGGGGRGGHDQVAEAGGRVGQPRGRPASAGPRRVVEGAHPESSRGLDRAHHARVRRCVHEQGGRTAREGGGEAVHILRVVDGAGAGQRVQQAQPRAQARRRLRSVPDQQRHAPVGGGGRGRGRRRELGPTCATARQSRAPVGVRRREGRVELHRDRLRDRLRPARRPPVTVRAGGQERERVPRPLQRQGRPGAAHEGRQVRVRVASGGRTEFQRVLPAAAAAAEVGRAPQPVEARQTPLTRRPHQRRRPFGATGDPGLADGHQEVRRPRSLAGRGGGVGRARDQVLQRRPPRASRPGMRGQVGAPIEGRRVGVQPQPEPAQVLVRVPRRQPPRVREQPGAVQRGLLALHLRMGFAHVGGVEPLVERGRGEVGRTRLQQAFRRRLDGVRLARPAPVQQPELRRADCVDPGASRPAARLREFAAGADPPAGRAAAAEVEPGLVVGHAQGVRVQLPVQVGVEGAVTAPLAHPVPDEVEQQVPVRQGEEVGVGVPIGPEVVALRQVRSLRRGQGLQVAAAALGGPRARIVARGGLGAQAGQVGVEPAVEVGVEVRRSLGRREPVRDPAHQAGDDRAHQTFPARKRSAAQGAGPCRSRRPTGQGRGAGGVRAAVRPV